MAHGKELELSLASPQTNNGLGGIPGSSEGSGILFQLIGCDCGIGYNQVLDHVPGMDTDKVQKAITKMPNEGVVNVVQEDGPKSVHVGNKLAELFQVSGVLTSMTEVRAAVVFGGITRGWTGGTGSIQATVLAMAWCWAAGITEPTWPRMPPPRWEGMERAAA